MYGIPLAAALAIDLTIVALATDEPALGQVRVSNELRKRSLFISPGGVRSVWLRHDLETFKKRLKNPKVSPPELFEFLG